MATTNANKAPRTRKKKPEVSEPKQEQIQFPDSIKRKLVAIMQQAAQLEGQLISTIDTFMDAKEIADKDTWRFDNKNLLLFREVPEKK